MAEELTYRSSLPHPPDRVYRWHTRRGAFQRLLPPWEDIRVLDPGEGIVPGSRVHLRIGRGPISLDWLVEHTEVVEGRRFVDEQVDGPFASWRHEHDFEPDGEGGCALTDRVVWEAPFGSAGSWIGSPFVEKELERVFRFRHERLRHDLDLLAGPSAPDRPLKVAITGASGLVGRNLCAFLRAGGHTVIPLVRSRERAGEESVYWNVRTGEIEGDRLEGSDALVHLAGEPLFGIRWTEEKKRRILESRRVGTRLVSETLAGLDRPPRVLLSASGSHFYGDGGEAVLTEESPAGEGFLAAVCREWEAATGPARDAGIRVVTLRTGIVLTPEGGALEKMLLPFKMGLGGRFGSGRQYMSWIDADDQLGLIHHALCRSDLDGPLNVVAPNPLTNAAFTDVLGRVLRRPTLIPVPKLAARAAMGRMGEELLLQGQRAVPARAEATGFSFSFPHLEDSLRHQLGRAEEGLDRGEAESGRRERASGGEV